MATVIAVCKSEEKGTPKVAQAEGTLRKNYGLVGDAHAASGSQRQVSLLATESIDKMRQLGFTLKSGDFAENLTTTGIQLVSLPLGTRLAIGEKVVLEITQIGKECHAACAIREIIGDCVMPREGIFARVIRGGHVHSGDPISIVPKR
jgi:MOSC domain-containing protein YiiM